MTVFLSVFDNLVIVRARAEGPGGIVGDLAQEVRPGGEFLGYSYQELRDLGDGKQHLHSRHVQRPSN